MPVPINLAADPTTYDVTEITRRLNAPSIMRFKTPGLRADQYPSGWTTRQVVSFIKDGVKLFFGVVLPQTFVVDAQEDAREYVAADILEYLANNPCAEVNEWYNRSAANALSGYPTGRTIRQILETEWASLINASSGLIDSIDWSGANGRDAIVIPDFSPKGKTWLGVLDALISEVPVLGYYYDPTTVPGSASLGVTNGVLRIIDTSNLPTALSASRVVVPFAKVTGHNVIADGNPLVERLNITQDISQSYDSVVVKGRGTFVEVEKEKLTAGWDTGDVSRMGPDTPFSTQLPRTLLRDDPGGGVKPQVWSISQWTSTYSVAESSAGRATPWYPEKPRTNDQLAYRRYLASGRVANFRLEQNPVTGVLGEVEAPLKVYHLFYVRREYRCTLANNYSQAGGGLQFRISVPPNTVTYIGSLGGANGERRSIAFSNRQPDQLNGNAQVVDLGDSLPHEGYYPNYPTVDLENSPLIEVEGEVTTEGNYIILPEPLVAQFTYNFPNNAIGVPSTYNALPSTTGLTYYVYWPFGADVWMDYTKQTDLEATRTDGSRGWEKKLVLYEQRLFKYTDANGNVLRDDTDLLEEYADIVFDAVNRPTYDGDCVVHATVSDIANYQLGKAVRFTNFPDPNNVALAYWAPEGVIREISILPTTTEARLTFRFNSEINFDPIERTKVFRSYIRRNEETGQGGLGGGVSGLIGIGVGFNG